jgi:hypothetical protein
MQKQNVFDDFIAAADLIAQKYTSSQYLAIRGGSNGGRCYHDATTRGDENGSGRDGHVALPPQEQVGRMITERRRTARKCLVTSKAILPYTM